MSSQSQELASRLKNSADPTEISIAHSPDSDDAFMFYGLATNKIRVPGYRFTHTLCDIETLNRRAREEAFYDVTAISFHAYPYLQENYTLMGCGGSVGEGYGPMIVSKGPLTPNDLGKIKVAIPGKLTTAYLALKIFNPAIETVTIPFDKIIPEILAGKHEAGLIIHEGQLTYSTSAFSRSSTLASGGAKPPAWSCLSAAMLFAARSAQNRTRSSPRPCAIVFSTPSTTVNRPWNMPCSSLAISMPGWPATL